MATIRELATARNRTSGLIRRLLGFAILTGILVLFGSAYSRSVAVTVVIMAIAAVALTVLMGWVGQPSVMTSGLILAGGYCAALLANSAHLGFPVVILATLLIGCALGWVISIPARRLGGLYQLLATLAYFYIIVSLGNQIQSSQGALGGYALPGASLGGLSISSTRTWLITDVFLLFLVVEYFSYLRRTRVGRGWIFIRENRDAAEVAGVPVKRFVSLAFALTSGIQFLAGALLAYRLMTVSYDNATLIDSVSFIVMIVLGGMGSIIGAIVGSAVVEAIPPIIEQAFGNGSGQGGFLSAHLTAIETLAYAAIAAAVVLRLDRRIVDRFQASRRSVHLQRRGAGVSVVPPAGGDWIASIEGLAVSYAGGSEVLHGVNLEVSGSAATAVVGRNGVGKTTLLSALAGFAPSVHAEQSAGHVWYRGPDGPVLLDGMGAMERSRLGIAFVPAEDKVFTTLSVEDHLRESLALHGRKAADGGLEELLEWFPALRELRHNRAGLLSGGERQQLAIAMAIGQRARLIIIDEASLGLSPALVRSVTDLLNRLKAEAKCTFLLAEQNPAMAFELADHVAVIDDGLITADGPPSVELLQTLERSYLGAAVPVGEAP